MKLKTGQKIASYALKRRLGKGGFGEVWLAKEDDIGRYVALKLLNPKIADKESITRFILESRNTAKLQHDNIISVFAADEFEGYYYMALPYIKGENLSDQGVFTEKKALSIINDVADALKYAWDTHKIIHRDIKPENIMIDEFKNVILMDMGIAKSLIDKRLSLTITGTVMGTPNFISPEQALASKDVDFRTDIFSLGVTLNYLITRELPFSAKNAMEIFNNVINKEVIDLYNINKYMSKQCARLIKKMTAKEPANRYASWGAVLKDINKVKMGEFPQITASKNKAKSDNISIIEENQDDNHSNITLKIIFALIILVIITLIIIL